jgi:hypothetical protein
MEPGLDERRRQQFHVVPDRALFTEEFTWPRVERATPGPSIMPKKCGDGPVEQVRRASATEIEQPDGDATDGRNVIDEQGLENLTRLADCFGGAKSLKGLDELAIICRNKKELVCRLTTYE